MPRPLRGSHQPTPQGNQGGDQFLSSTPIHR
jgi:hypothetical protein